eukprot:s3469_g7.t1
MNALPALRRDLDGLRAQLDDVSQRTAILTQQVIERDENMENLSDRQDGLQEDLTVRQQIQGYVTPGEDTDTTTPVPRAVSTGVTHAEAGEGGESSNADTD